MERLAYSVKEVLELVGIGRTKLYDLIKARELPARKIGSKTVILAADLDAWVRSLPVINSVDEEERSGGRPE
jgi:excisionase family DNA binding protein